MRNYRWWLSRKKRVMKKYKLYFGQYFSPKDRRVWYNKWIGRKRGRVMRRIIAILCVCLLLTGCGIRYEDAEDTLKVTGGGYFTLIKAWSENLKASYEIVYANDTKVKYLIWRSGYKGGITPLYNADGSLQVYEESEE